jgi:transcriptional regulator with XRE-family HTH domain
MMDVDRIIREARVRAGLTQTALAARAGTSQATISAYESGRKEPSVQTLSRLLAATGSRLVAQPVREWDREWVELDHARNAGILGQVLELAEALPFARERELRFPRIPRAA